MPNKIEFSRRDMWRCIRYPETLAGSSISCRYAYLGTHANLSAGPFAPSFRLLTPVRLVCPNSLIHVLIHSAGPARPAHKVISFAQSLCGIFHQSSERSTSSDLHRSYCAPAHVCPVPRKRFLPANPHLVDALMQLAPPKSNDKYDGECVHITRL